MWRFLGFLGLIWLKPKEFRVDSEKETSYLSLFRDKAFLLYFFPWLMFLLINNLTYSINNDIFPAELVRYSSLIESALSGVFAVIFGFLADVIGRKRLAIAGFVLMGLDYGILAFSQNGNIAGWVAYTVMDGIAWGAFFNIFLFTIWGDLSKGQSHEKYYAIGSLPYLVSNLLRFTIGDYLSSSIHDYVMIFSFASFFLFLAVLPLIYAPETLSEKAMKDRDLKSYVDKAMKIQKENEKTQKTQRKPPKNKEEASAETESSKEDEEAKRLAEKYY